MYTYIILRFGLFLILNRNILSDASCSLPTDIKNSDWEYNYTKVSDNSPQSTILRVSTTTLQNSIINLSAVGTTIDDWTCINSLALSNTQTLVVFKSDTTFSDGPFKNYRLYLCMKFTKVTPDLYYFYLLSETSDEIPGNAALCEPCNSTCQVDRCDPNPCQNNGSCVDFKENYTCTCTDGWKGENCTKDINECLDKQRTAMCPQHSDCLNTDGSYDCNCKIGYQETNGTCTDRCDPNPCQNNGSCVDFKESYTCTCTDGWKGENCTKDINECLDKQRTAMCPQYSDCLNTDGSYRCNCKVGYQETNGTCTENKMSTEDKSKDLGSKIGLYVGIPVLLLILVILIIAFIIWRKRTRQSTFGVNSYTNSGGHKNGENELTEVEQNLVVKT